MTRKLPKVGDWVLIVMDEMGSHVGRTARVKKLDPRCPVGLKVAVDITNNSWDRVWLFDWRPATPEEVADEQLARSAL
jgi:hypothetical protein